ncbi:MAG TPA: tryptophan-rich sensory protein [Prolixibacteraceae bacterium]|nr:tryptophan-rich sensory protein [Prolixibacteraceae bacterium]
MVQKIGNLILFGFMIVMNYLANALPLNNKTTGQLSDEYPNLFVPTGLTFSIWGVIYLLILIFCIIQFFQSNRETIRSIGWLFSLSCVLNGLWIVAWHYQNLPLSLLLMVGLLIVLIFINQKISSLPFGLIKAAFGIYLGWICIASIANVTALLVYYGWGAWGISELVWTVLLIVVGLLISSVTLIRFQNPFLGLVVAWAFLGIALKRQADEPMIFFVALGAMVLVLFVAGAGFFPKKIPIRFGK